MLNAYLSHAAKACFALICLSLPVLAGDPQSSSPKSNSNQPSGTATVAESSSHPARKGRPAAAPKASPPLAAPDAQLDEDVYRIGVDDDLQISVWREPELSSPVVVRMDGKITLPLLSDVTVVGLRTDELQALLTEKLKAFVNEPQVTVVVRQIRSRKVYLFGEVIRQGTYAMSGRKTILELLADAGGPGPFAKSDSIYILRQRGSQQVRIPFNHKKALAGRSVNLQLLPGDVVVVP